MRRSDAVNERNMNFLTGSDRQQTQLLPVALDDYVSTDNPVRFLDGFVDTLDLKGAGFGFPQEKSRRPRSARLRPRLPA